VTRNSKTKINGAYVKNTHQANCIYEILATAVINIWLSELTQNGKIWHDPMSKNTTPISLSPWRNWKVEVPWRPDIHRDKLLL